jgi:hypothetical protein
MVLWVFGLATTLLLVGLWGRAVTHDQATVQASARSAIDAEIASDRIYSWIEEGVASSTDVDPQSAGQVISGLRNHPEVEAAVGAVVDEFIGALFADEGEVASVELTQTLAPIVPLVASRLAANDIPIDESTLATVLAEAEGIDLQTGDVATVARVVDDARSVLSLIVFLAALTLVVTGVSAIRLSRDRLAMVRTLASRMVLSALSFAVLFRVGSWALDPNRGGSPIARGGSILLGSNADVFLRVALGAAVVSAGVGWVLWRRSKSAVQPGERPDTDADTKELISI